MTEEGKLEHEVNDMWTAVKSAVDNVFERDLTPDEFFYLLSCYPHLELCNIDYPYIDPGTKAEVIKMPNGWQVLDLQSVITTSASELQQRRHAYPRLGSSLSLSTHDDDEEGGGHGTIVKQFADIAEAMIDLAIKKGWKAAEIISGYYPMQRVAWVVSMERNYELRGFEPTGEDLVVADWISQVRNKKLYDKSKKKMLTPKA